MTTATTPTPTPTTTSTILRAKLGSDGTMKLTLAAKEAARLLTVKSLCRTLATIPAIEAKAKAAFEALDALAKELL